MSVRVPLLALSLAVLAGGAHAQEAPIARTSVDAAPPANAAPAAIQPAPAVARPSSDPIQDQIDGWVKAGSDTIPPLDGRGPPEEPPGPRQIHGEVGAMISNRGYSGYAAAAVPIGEASELDVAVAAGQVRTPWGKANPRSLSVGLFLDAGDVGRWISRDKCHVPRWGVSLPDDPQVRPDGSCMRTEPRPQAAP